MILNHFEIESSFQKKQLLELFFSGDFQNREVWVIHEIGHLRFLSGAISQKRTEIVDFTDFYETFWSECRERMKRPK